MPKKSKVEWLSQPKVKNYDASKRYLCLLMGHREVEDTVARLKKASVIQSEAKNIFRASRLPLLGISNSHVEKSIEKIEKGKSLSPLLLVRDEKNSKLIIADGYHRLCAVYRFNEDAMIPCKVV